MTGLESRSISGMHSIVCIYPAPIPVGHRVEVLWFTEEVEGIFSGSKTHVYDAEPYIKDLDTGIEYASHRAFVHGGMKMSHQPLEVGEQANPSLRVSHRIVGVVRRCRVITCVAFSGDPLQTHLDVEVTS